MGSKQSALEAEDDSLMEEQEQPCCFFPGPPNLRSVSSDPMGTPLPGTPMHQRRKRERILEEARNNPVMMSTYGGLEKETEAYYKPKVLASPTANGNGNVPQVYEGEDSEKAMHAKYELLEVLGVGSTSTVHRCMDRKTMRDCACKVIDKRHIAERFQGMMEQFHTEIQSLRKLQHPNIIRLYDVFISEEKIFIVMELMHGGELFDYVVQKGTLTEEEASAIVRKVTSAIVYMHSKNIIHRDLKPENLLLRHTPKTPMDLDVKIIDFGLSKCMVEPVTSSFLGTRGYLAPEMLQRMEYSTAVDTWALGVIVFVLLCGCLPFDDDSQAVPTEDLVRARFVLRFPRWAKDLSGSAKDLLSRLLNVTPGSRYTAEQALHHPWVQGETAPKENRLESPGRIKLSPHTRRKHRRTNSKDYTAVQQHQQGTLVAPKRQLVRKTSI
mmetsp:Transcript_6353/g.10535  ORF Transcript_6353/g.10535 Transcript_6353/m.10535 type:complete len:439 (-) Transcript_6353:4-1320(-)